MLYKILADAYPQYANAFIWKPIFEPRSLNLNLHYYQQSFTHFGFDFFVPPFLL